MFSELVNMEKDKNTDQSDNNNLIQLKPPSPGRLKKTTILKTFISENIIEQNKTCTFFLYGDMPIKQMMYICGKCDFYQLDPMCEDCYNNCHRECYSNENKKLVNRLLNTKAPGSLISPEVESKKLMENEKKRKMKKKETRKMIAEIQRSANKGLQTFSCLCGKKHKHQKSKTCTFEDENVEEKCNLEKEVSPSLFKSKEKFYCNECDSQICSMCASGCHFFHNVTISPLNKEENTEFNCYCYNTNHSMNDFLLNVFFDSTLRIRFPVLTSSKTKTMNMMFITKELFHNLSIFLKKFLQSSTSKLIKLKTKNRNKPRRNSEKSEKIIELKEKIEVKVTNLDNINQIQNEDNEMLHGLKSDNNMRKFIEISGIFFKILYERNEKCYFYNDELRKIFAHNTSFRLIENLCDMDYNINNSRLILNLVGIIFYLHVKSDFQQVKNFTISDFMGSKIVTRLKYKKKFMDIATLSGKEDSIEANEENTDVRNPFIHLRKYFNESCSLSTISIKLSKIITDCLPALNILSNPTLYEVCLRFINFGLKKMFFTKSELKCLIENFSNFISDFYQIMNTPKNLQNMKENFEETKYVYYYLIKICYLIAVNYNDMVTEELVGEYKLTNNLSIDQKRKAYIHANEEYGDKLFKMILKTVMIVAESYQYDLVLDRKVINICNESLKIFSITENFYMDQLSRLKEKEIINYDVESHYFKHSEIFSLASKLRNKISEIFIGDNTDKLSGENKLYLQIDEILKDILNTNPNLINNCVNPFEYDEKNPKETKISQYRLKLLNFFSEIIGSSREDFYYSYSALLYSDGFIDNLISSNFDEIVSKYFSLFKYKNLDQRDANAAISIYLLYCMNRKGVEHLCTGKNLSIITKLFASTKNAKNLLCDEIKLEFLYLLIKGFYINKIDLSNDKSIYNITAIIELINSESREEGSITENYQFPHIDDIPFKCKQRILKIFSILKDSLEFEEFEKIQEIIYYKFRKLFDTNMFKGYINEFEKNKIDLNLFSKANSRMISSKNFRIGLFSNSDKEFSAKFVSNLNYDEKTKLIGDDYDSVKPNLLPNENILKLSDNNSNNPIIRTFYKSKSDALKFYFSLFRFLSINTYYIFYDFPEEQQQLEDIYKFVDLEFMQTILSKTFLPLNYRTCLLVFLRTFYFIDILDSKSKNGFVDHISTEEMYKYLNKLYNKDEQTLIEQRANLIFKIISVMDIFVSELEMFDGILKNEKFYFEDVQDYLIQIVYSVKIITDFVYYQKTIWDNLNWYLYKIGKRFVRKADIIKNILLNIKRIGEIGEIIDEDSNISRRMESLNFDFYNKDLIYNLISDSLIDILKATNVDKNFKLEKYLKEQDRKIRNDFTPSGVINWKGYDELYTIKEPVTLDKINAMSSKFGNEEEENKDTEDARQKRSKEVEREKNKNVLRKMLRDIYKTPFVRIYDTCLLRVMNTFKTKDDSVDYRRILINYFMKFISSDAENKKFFVKVSNKIYTEETTLTLLIIIVKLLYYDTKNTQNKFDILNTRYISPSDDANLANDEQSLDLCKQFFKSFYNKLQKIFVLHFSTSINFFMFDRYTEISELNKLMIQFLQLLAEGFQLSFKSKIFELKLTTTESISLFDIIYSQFKTAYNLMDLNSKIANNNELSHYKLIVLFSNIIDFFIEYVEGTDTSTDSNKITQMMQNILDDQIHKCLLKRIDSKIDKAEGITDAKIELCQKLLLRVKSKILELLISFLENGVDESFLKRILKELPMTRIFEEIQYYLHELLTKIQNKAIIEDGSSNYKEILNVYNYDKASFCYVLTKLYILNDDFMNSLELNFCMKLFMYLNILSDVHGIKTIEEHFAQLKINKKLGLKVTKNLNQDSNTNSVTSFLSSHAAKIYKFMKNVVRKVDVKNFEENKIYKTFFFRPPITFYLSNPTQRRFIDTVDRESRFSKLSSLIRQTDYFMFEMVYYSHFNVVGRRINTFLDLYYHEMINYLFIVIHQIFLLVYYYRSTKLSDDEYSISIEDKYEIQNENFVLSMIQIAYIAIILILWFFFQLPLTLFSNLMSGDSTFLFKKEGEEKREIIYKYNQTSSLKETFSHIKFIKNVMKHAGFWNKLKVILFDCILLNKTVNTFAFTLIFTILYLTTGSALFIVFPILFIINIIPILFGMFVAIKTKWQQLLTMLIFTYLCIYFFMWITFYFTYPLFEFDDIHASDGDSKPENLCTSAIECYLTMIDLGFRSGGGIGDVLPKASWKNGISFYIIRFFYNITFHIFIILILANSCFGIIIDAFSDLRDKTNAIEEDKKNICFICQLSRDDSLNKNINFDQHVMKVHYPWDYVYFISHLLLNDPNDFNSTEYYVWEKISKSTYDIGWIPGDTEKDENRF